MLGYGCIHPQGENNDYNGPYFKESEMQGLANSLKGLPLCVEHIQDEHVGKELHGWVGQDNNVG